ncbi:glycoside hydrolase family 3 [Mucilaginibacter daejeonensis]|uniref:glycoside hydrolase family 3 protein n=1 Tax=Mucilaginibacter daejeonensis TaxID=398049 RepID=UPI001D17432B|nr:glycoside hydrolase family 3 N-terminal domain-containing protein [Mucilaginibacter daejeonensis]UEG53146.1 glycoside hydrolase family 3 [Mucilaginibacter daejeonensis]
MNILKRSTVTAAALLLTATASFAQKADFISSLNTPNRWVDSVFKTLDRKHKIAQLFFIRAHTNKGQAYADSVARVIQEEQPGGLVFFQGGPVRQAQLTNRYQKLSNIPMLVAMDGEWGLGMRLDSTISYPYQMTLGAIQNDKLIREMGKQIAFDFKRIGAHINFAPVLDVNNNPNNPVINYRSFGDDKYKVALRGIAYMQGMQQAGLITTAKHFPGHGDTNVDSHFDLPQLPFTRQRLDTLEEYPFKEAIKAGISGVMVAHLSIPALEPAKNMPSSLSRPIITGILKNQLGFKGLVVSDAMEMKGVTKYFPNGEADLRAFMAGTDIIELSENSYGAIKAIRRAIRSGKVSDAVLDAKVKKVLYAKYWAGLANYSPADVQGISADLNRNTAKELVQQLSDNAVTMLQDNGLLERFNFMQKTALVSIGVTLPTVYQQELAKYYLNSTLFTLKKNAQPYEINKLINDLKGYKQIIIGVHDERLRPQSKLDLTAQVKDAVVQIAEMPNAALSLFANPYTLASMPGIERTGVLLAAYQKDESMQRAAARVLSRQLTPSGRLPVNINSYFTNGWGMGQPKIAL